MKPDACAMASLMEAERDGRLGEREAGSLARHLDTCAACRDLARDLDEVRHLLRLPSGTPPTPLEHQRGRLALLRAAAAPSSSRPRRWDIGQSLAWLGAASSPAGSRRAIGLAVSAFIAVVSVSSAAWLRSAAPSSCPVAQHLRLHPSWGTPGSAPRRALAALHDGQRVETTIHGSSEARFERRTEGQVERVALSEGTLELFVRHLSPSERFLVATDDAEVEVRGTVFEVEAHGGRIARVEVSEGKVEVRYHRGVSVVAAGSAWRPPMDAPVTLAPPQSIPEPAARPIAPPPTRSSPTTPAAPMALLPGRPTAREHENDALRDGPPHDGAASGSDPRPESPTRTEASQAFTDAVDMLGRGDYAAARSQLDAFRAAHPADDRADLAAFLTIISLQRAGRRSEAQDAARRYLELYPNGDRRTDAARVAAAR